MSETLQRISTSCFGLSYLLAFGLELLLARWPRRGLRTASLTLGAAGWIAHSIFLALHHPTPATASGALLGLAWVLAVFYLYGSLHHARRAWAIFVLPVVLLLIGLSVGISFFGPPEVASEEWFAGPRIWGAIHGFFVLFASVGVGVGAIASAMYLIQAARLKAKKNPLGGLKMLSLERLEAMNRRAITIAFPLLTVGLLLGAVLLRHYHDFGAKWFSVKVLGTLGLWGVFALLLYLRYSARVSGRRLAWMTLFAFALMVVVLVWSHPFAGADSSLGGAP